MIERLGFLAREGEDLLHARRVRDVADIFVSGPLPTCFSTSMRTVSRSRPSFCSTLTATPLAELDQAKEQVLRTHIIMVEAIGFLPGQRENLLSAGGEIIHLVFFSLSASGFVKASVFVFGSGTDFRRSRSRSERSPVALFCRKFAVVIFFAGAPAACG